MRLSTWVPVLLCFWLALDLAAFGTCQEVPVKEVPVKLETLAGQTIQGTLRVVRENGELEGSGWSDPLKLGLISLIDFSRPIQAVSGEAVKLKLVGGGEALVRNPKLEGERLTFDSATLPIQLPLEAISGIVWKENERVAAAISAPLSDNDQVLVETAEGTIVVAGLLEGLSGEKVQINYQDKSRTIDLEKVLAIVPASLDSGSSVATGSSVRLILTDGSSLVGQLSGFDSQQWKLRLSSGTQVEGPTEAISRMEISSDRQVYLSDLTPVESEQRVLFGQPRQWTRDQSLVGDSLRIYPRAGAEATSFRKGLAMRATTRVVFANANGYTRILADVGLDPDLGVQGDCEVIVRGDGIELWKRRLTAENPSEKLDLEVAGYRLIEVRVEPGEQYDLGDFVNWGNARLLKLEQ